MREETFTFSETDLAAAVRGLRDALGRSTEVMAEIVGCSLPAYQKWEMGLAIPEGEWLIRLLRLCPNEDCRNAFRIRAERRSRSRPEIPLGPLSAAERRDYLRMAHEAADELFRCGEDGIEAAGARLADFAVNMRSAAGFYRRK